jgi:hypothetical protein
MSQYYVSQLLSKEESIHYSNLIDSLYDKWSIRKFQGGHYYTLGLATHLDGPEHDEIASKEYIERCYESNTLLLKNFSPLYDMAIKEITNNIGPCELIKEGPVPGFYIYGEPKSKVEEIYLDHPEGSTAIHTDVQIDRLGYLWSKYSDVEDSTMSFTLAIDVPKFGASILLWDQPDTGIYSDSEYALWCKQRDYSLYPDNKYMLKNNISNLIPDVVEHKPGQMFFQEGKIYHAVGHTQKPLNVDRRITLQGFGKKCDGIWRLCF